MARILALFLCLLAGCHGASSCLWSSAPLTAETQALAGDRAAPALEARYGGVVYYPDAEARLSRLGERLCAANPEFDYPCRYFLLNSDQLNAFSLPGRVYLTRGLYQTLEAGDALAAVLAHELAHVARKDHFKARPSGTDEALQRELAADALGMRFMQAAGIRAEAMVTALRAIEEVQPAGWADIRIAALAQTRPAHQPNDAYAQARP